MKNSLVPAKVTSLRAMPMASHLPNAQAKRNTQRQGALIFTNIPECKAAKEVIRFTTDPLGEQAKVYLHSSSANPNAYEAFFQGLKSRFHLLFQRNQENPGFRGFGFLEPTLQEGESLQAFNKRAWGIEKKVQASLQKVLPTPLSVHQEDIPVQRLLNDLSAAQATPGQSILTALTDGSISLKDYEQNGTLFLPSQLRPFKRLNSV
jgi:hypothetical protein